MKVPVSNILILGASAFVLGVALVSLMANNANSQTPGPSLADALYGPPAEKTRDGLPPIDAAQPKQFATATFAVG